LYFGNDRVAGLRGNENVSCHSCRPHRPAPHEFRNYPCRLWGCGQAGGGAWGPPRWGGPRWWGGITEGAAGQRLLSQCRRCGGHMPKIWGITSPVAQAAHSDSKCAAALIRQCMHVAPTWGIPPGAPAVHSDSGAVAVAWRSWSLRTSATRAPDGCARLARRPSSEGSRIHGAGPSVCGTSRACTLETHSGSRRPHCRSSSGSWCENIVRKPPASGETSPPRSCCCDPPNRAPEGQKKGDFFP
jgi:hypothetical protein